MAQVQNPNINSSGVAHIKQEYLVQDHVRELNMSFVAANDKKKVSHENEKESSEEPPKKKLKGQNKHRPRGKRTPKSEKLCFKIAVYGSCPFGDSCCYCHDVNAYLAKKPPDIGPTCYLYETFGKCPYSFACRFGSQHTKDGQNLTIDDITEKCKEKTFFSNILDKELQKSLRKYTYDFSKSNEVINKLNVTSNDKLVGSVDEHNDFFPMPEIKKVDFEGKLFLAPLTTVGNLPFRRICKEFGADITCSEMAMALSLLQGQQSEWALLKRHHTEDIFGIQLCGSHADLMTRCSQVLSETISFDFIDLNLGCPLDAICRKGAGCGLMSRMKKFEGIIYGVTSVIDVPLTVKMRKGIYGCDKTAHNVIKRIHEWENRVSLITVHGRSREQRYTKSADWDCISVCNELAQPIPLFGNGDILSYEDYNIRKKESDVAGIMIARGALIKPWIFKEIKEQKHWDISSSERFDILKNFTNYGLEHWGSDSEGVEKTRRFLLEWLSFLHRYIPVGLLEHVPQRINERPPAYFGRNDLETLMASPSCRDWIKISEMLLGPVPEEFVFLPKHKANAYE